MSEVSLYSGVSRGGAGRRRVRAASSYLLLSSLELSDTRVYEPQMLEGPCLAKWRRTERCAENGGAVIMRIGER